MVRSLGGDGDAMPWKAVWLDRADIFSRPAPASSAIAWHKGRWANREDAVVHAPVWFVAPNFRTDAALANARPGTGGELRRYFYLRLHLLAGRLSGMRIRDDLMVLDYLYFRTTDKARIGVTGIAVVPDIFDDCFRAGVGVACMTRYQESIKRRA